MSDEPFEKTSRRDFLSAATIATAATLAGPVSSEAQSPNSANPAERTKVADLGPDANPQLMARAKASDWTKPAAMAVPKEGYFTLEQGRYGPIFPKTPANYGFTIIAKIKPGRE